MTRKAHLLSCVAASMLLSVASAVPGATAETAPSVHAAPAARKALPTKLATEVAHLDSLNAEIRAKGLSSPDLKLDPEEIIKIVYALYEVYETMKAYDALPLPPIKPVTDWGYVQNISESEHDWFWRTPQGTYVMPYSWFLALEAPEQGKAVNLPTRRPSVKGVLPAKWRADGIGANASDKFASADYLAHFGMLTLPVSTSNPDGLPAGLTRQENFVDPTDSTGVRQTVLGMGCALCHSGKVEFNGKTAYIDGAPAQTSLDLFGAKFAVALVQTLLPDGITDWRFTRFNRFATSVYQHKPNDVEWLALYIEFAEYVLKNAAGAGGNEQTTQAGFFRLDALDNIGNQVFGADLQTPANVAATTAPVSYPMIWTVPWLAWAEYPGVVRNPMIRNVGEALGVKAPINLVAADKGTESTSPLYKSTAMIDNLFRFESLLMEGTSDPAPTDDPWQTVKNTKALPGLPAPSWAMGVKTLGLPDINAERAAKGKPLYAALCQGCHLPPLNDPHIGDTDPATGALNSDYWEPLSADEGMAPKYRRQFLKVKKLNIQEIGTDPQEVLNFALRFPNFGTMTWNELSGIPRTFDTTDAAGTPKVGQTITMADGLKFTTQAAAYRWYKDNNKSEDDIARMNGYRPNVVLLEPTYRARPLDGIWATGPFLHNGSVPNLYELLLPASERAKSFVVGLPQFDPKKVGFLSHENDSDEKKKEIVKLGYSLFSVYKDDGKTPIPGNSNAGHEFKDGPLGNGVVGPALSDEQRYDLIEYLKTL